MKSADLEAECRALRHELSLVAKQLPRLRQMVEYSTDLMLLLGTDGAILDCNRAAALTLGGEREALYGLSLDTFARSWTEDILRAVDALARKSQLNVEGTLFRLDGTSFPVELSLSKVIVCGKPVCVVSARDITARQQLTARSMQMDRIIAAGTLAAGTAHEINNPLAYVMSNLEYVLDGVRTGQPITAEMREALEEAQNGVARVRDIVVDLKNLTRSEDEGNASNLATCIQSAVTMANNEIRHCAQLVVDIEDLPPVVGTESRLSQVFLNLLINAAHAIPVGNANENQITIRARRENNTVVVSVQDTGSGIAPDNVPRIFDSFFTTKAVGKGTGLGLSICRDTVMAAGGTLTVESTVGVGTTFFVRLPIHTAPASRHNEPLAVTTHEGQRTANILAIDDEKSICKVLQRLLTHQGHRVTTTTSPVEALDWLGEGQSFDVVLCDLMMPDMTGKQFYDRLATVSPSHSERVAFITGGTFSRNLDRFLAQMRNRCIAKPFKKEQLLGVIDLVLAGPPDPGVETRI